MIVSSEQRKYRHALRINIPKGEFLGNRLVEHTSPKGAARNWSGSQHIFLSAHAEAYSSLFGSMPSEARMEKANGNCKRRVKAELEMWSTALTKSLHVAELQQQQKHPN